MELEELVFGLGGWIVATLVIVSHIRDGRLLREEIGKLERLATHLIQATERQRESLNNLVALGQPGSEVRDEAVTALQVANTAVGEVLRAEPRLKPEGFTLSPVSEQSDQ